MSTMRAVLVNQPGMSIIKLVIIIWILNVYFVGDASQLSLGSFEKPVPKDTEILVKVSTNPANENVNW